jgi:hypothetical protein
VRAEVGSEAQRAAELLRAGEVIALEQRPGGRHQRHPASLTEVWRAEIRF